MARPGLLMQQAFRADWGMLYIHAIPPFFVKVLRSRWYVSGFYHNMGQYVQRVFFEALPQLLFIYSW